MTNTGPKHDRQPTMTLRRIASSRASLREPVAQRTVCIERSDGRGAEDDERMVFYDKRSRLISITEAYSRVAPEVERDNG
jgi:hypothetical protein